jgi:hypothetical protein
MNAIYQFQEILSAFNATYNVWQLIKDSNLYLRSYYKSIDIDVI